jgi:hypothetical protein
MAKIKYDPKDPDERDDFKLAWATRLAPFDDTVDTSSWTIVTDQTGSANPLNIFDEDVLDAALSTRLWLEGGVEGTTYEILNEIVTLGGRTLQQTIYIPVKSH